MFFARAWTPKSVILLRDHSDDNIPEYAAVCRVHGPFLFGASDKICVTTDNLDKLPAIVIVRLCNMTAIDTTGTTAPEELADQLHKSVGAENICENITIALKRGEATIDNKGRAAVPAPANSL